MVCSYVKLLLCSQSGEAFVGKQAPMRGSIMTISKLYQPPILYLFTLFIITYIEITIPEYVSLRASPDLGGGRTVP
jgi:hypothetical protein